MAAWVVLSCVDDCADDGDCRRFEMSARDRVEAQHSTTNQAQNYLSASVENL